MKTLAGVAADGQAGPRAGWLRFLERFMTDLHNDRFARLCAPLRAGCAHGSHRRQKGDGHPGQITLREGEIPGQLTRLVLDSLSPELARRTDSRLFRQFTRMVPEGRLGPGRGRR